MDNPVVRVVKEYEMCLEEEPENIDKLTGLMAKVDELNAWNFESELKQILGKLNLHRIAVVYLPAVGFLLLQGDL